MHKAANTGLRVLELLNNQAQSQTMERVLAEIQSLPEDIRRMYLTSDELGAFSCGGSPAESDAGSGALTPIIGCASLGSVSGTCYRGGIQPQTRESVP